MLQNKKLIKLAILLYCENTHQIYKVIFFFENRPYLLRRMLVSYLKFQFPKVQHRTTTRRFCSCRYFLVTLQLPSIVTVPVCVCLVKSRRAEMLLVFSELVRAVFILFPLYLQMEMMMQFVLYVTFLVRRVT